jgi:phage tail protein X
MIRALFTIGFLLFLAAVGVWFCRNHWDVAPETQQAEANPKAPAPPTVVPPAPDVRPVDIAPPAPPPQPQPQPYERPVANPAQVVPQNAVPNPPTPRVGKRTHVVASGETLWVISRRYFGTPAYVEAIADANHMDAPNRLRPGMLLVLPEIPGVPARGDEVAQPAPRVESSEAPQQHAEPMPPTLSRTVPVDP